MSNIVDYADNGPGDDIRPLFSPPSKLSGYYNLKVEGVGCIQLRAFTRQRSGIVIDSDTDSPGSPMLFLDYIWPASYHLCDYLVSHSSICQGKSVLELGAAAALPSCVAYHMGAQHVVATDFPADGVIENIENVMLTNGVVSQGGDALDRSATALGFVWGDDANMLLDLSPNRRGFDVILMADLLWKDTYPQHRALLSTIKSCLRPTRADPAVALMAFAHRPTDSHLPKHDLEFFDVASNEFGFHCELLASTTAYQDVYDGDIASGVDEAEIEPFTLFLYSMQYSDNDSIDSCDRTTEFH